MKILHIIPDLALTSGGPVFAVLGMTKAQSSMGHSVTIVSTDFGQSEPFAQWLFPNVLVGNPKSGSPIKTFGDDSFNIHLYSCDFPKWRWSSKLKEGLYSHIGDADIVHIHTVWSFPVLAAVDVCIKLDKPYVLRPCGMLDPWSLSQRRWIKRLYLLCFKKIIAKATAIHFTSKQERENSSPLFKVVRSFICPLGVSLSDATPIRPTSDELGISAGFRRRFHELGDSLIVLFLSRMHHKKQPEVVIHAFHEIISRGQNLRLLMTGSGEAKYVRRLKRLVNDLGLADKVLFTGMLLGRAKQEALSAAGVFVLPSLQENFGISVVEAMAAGCPVVVSDRINIAPDIARARAGIVCSPKVDEVTSAIGQLVRDGELRRQMGENGRKLVRDQFEWKIVTKSLLVEYDHILKGQPVIARQRSLSFPHALGGNPKSGSPTKTFGDDTSRQIASTLPGTLSRNDWNAPRNRVLYSYAQLGGLDFGFFRFPGMGLGNLLFPWARFIVATRKYHLTPICPTWPQFKLGPHLRNEMDKRFYSDLFYRPNDHIDGLRKLFLLSSLKKIKESDFEQLIRRKQVMKQDMIVVPRSLCSSDHSPSPSPLPLQGGEDKGEGVESSSNLSSGIVIFQGMDGCFQQILKDHELVLSELLKMTREQHKKGFTESLRKTIGVHVRRGDFAEPERIHLLESGSANCRIPLSWYVRQIQQLREAIGSDVSVNIFSDGTDEELSELLALKNVKRMNFGSSIADLLALSRSGVLIASGSTFSMWASYLGRMPVIWYRGQLKQKLYDDTEEMEIECDQNSKLPVNFIDHLASKFFSEVGYLGHER